MASLEKRILVLLSRRSDGVDLRVPQAAPEYRTVQYTMFALCFSGERVARMKILDVCSGQERCSMLFGHQAKSKASILLLLMIESLLPGSKDRDMPAAIQNSC